MKSREAFEKWIKDNNIFFVTKWAWSMWQAAEAHAKGEPMRAWDEGTVTPELDQTLKELIRRKNELEEQGRV